MKIKSSRNTYGKTIHEVELGPEDEGKTNAQMITAADYNGRYVEGYSHPFGGTVSKSADGTTATITVYTD